MTDEAIKRKILMNHVKLQERTIEQIVEFVVQQFNVQSYYAALLSEEFVSGESEGVESYFEADGRRSQARNTLAKIAELAGVEFEYKNREGCTHRDGEPVTFRWCEAQIISEED